MSIKIKLVLIIVLACATILSIGTLKVEKVKNKSSKVISNNVAFDSVEQNQEDEVEGYIVETTKPEIVEEPQKETGMEENHQEQSVESVETEVDEVESVEIKVSTDYDNYNVPNNNAIKSYMDYRCITSTGSRQYKLQHSLAYTGDNGIRMANGRYCVAVGSYYTTTIGQYIDIELENGNIIHGILADCKADKDTDSTNRMHSDGSVVEFVVDSKSLDSTVRKMGDVSYVNGWNSKVVNIKVCDKIADY